MTDTNGGAAEAKACSGCGTLLGPHAVFQLEVEHPDVHTPERCELLAGYNAFWDAVGDEDSNVTFTDRVKGIVDGHGEDIVDALIAAGWRPPPTAAERQWRSDLAEQALMNRIRML